MPYETYYRARVSPLPEGVTTTKLLNSLDLSHLGEWLEREDGWADLSDCCAWYEHRAELTEVTLNLPVLIELMGVGEEEADQWIQYFWGGAALKYRRPMPPAWVPPPPPEGWGPPRDNGGA